MDADTKKELAASLRRIAESQNCAPGVALALDEEADRIDPPTREPVWPKTEWRPVARMGMKEVAVDLYPAGVVGPVVEALRQMHEGYHRGYISPCICTHALVAFDAACQGKEKP